MEHPFTICYFGIYNPEFSRNRIYISGLRKAGITVIECRDDSRGLVKFWNLWKKHGTLRNEYSALIVGYPGHIVTPLARLVSRKKVIFDALGTLYEAEVMSHGAGLITRIKTRLIDWLAVKSAHVVLVESEPQKEYFLKRFGGPSEKYQVLHTGADDEVLLKSEERDGAPESSKVGFPAREFTVLFRGSLTPEAGLETILKAASILEKNYANEKISFLILGRGRNEKLVRDQINEMSLERVTFDTQIIPWPRLVAMMRQCSVSLGQFSLNQRLDRTIPHKAFEAMALGLPYITARASGVGSVLLEGKHCLMVTAADPDDLVAKILELKHNPVLAQSLSECAHAEYLEKYTPLALARRLMTILG